MVMHGSPWNMSHIRASCERDIRAWRGLSDTWADGRLSSYPSSAAVAAVAAAGDAAGLVVVSLPAMRLAAAAAAGTVAGTGSSEAAVMPRRRPRAAGDRRSCPAACVSPAPSTGSASRRRTGHRTAPRRPRLPSGRPSWWFDGASL